MSRYRILKPALFTLAASIAAACGGSDGDAPKGAASFAQASTAQREAAIRAGLGVGPAQGFLALFMAELDHAQNPACPSRTQVGDTIVYEASGCTGAVFGATYRGRAEATNSPFTGGIFSEDSGADPTKPMELRFVDFHADRAEQKLALDGTLWQSSPEPEAGYTAKSHLVVDDGVAVRIDVDMSCAPAGAALRCTNDADARGEITALGDFAIAFDVAHQGEDDSEATGWLELRGEDVLRLSMSKDADGCLPYTIDGAAAGHMCPDESSQPEPDPDPPVSPGVTGLGYSCSGDVLSLEADTEPNVTALTVTVKQGAFVREVPLVRTQVGEGSEIVTTFQADLALGGDVPLDCGALEHVGFRFDATLDDGSAQCQLYGDESQFAGETCQ
jgi:hypothetical protein